MATGKLSCVKTRAIAEASLATGPRTMMLRTGCRLQASVCRLDHPNGTRTGLRRSGPACQTCTPTPVLIRSYEGERPNPIDLNHHPVRSATSAGRVQYRQCGTVHSLSTSNLDESADRFSDRCDFETYCVSGPRSLSAPVLYCPQ